MHRTNEQGCVGLGINFRILHGESRMENAWSQGLGHEEEKQTGKKSKKLTLSFRPLEVRPTRC